jgi:hypothetical protein
LTFEQARARLADVEALPNNALIEMYGLPEGLHPPPEGLFDDNEDNSGFWTDILIADHGEGIKHARPYLTPAIINIDNRSKTRKKKFSHLDKILM